MKTIIFLFVGIIFIIVGVIIYNSDTNVYINHQRASEKDGKMVIHYTGAGLMGLGGIFALIGLIGFVRNNKQNKRNQYILQNGIDALGTVTFVERNWKILLNKNPIYSIVEYNYKDNLGNQYTRKISNMSSELVIRKQIQVGAKIPIRYLSDNPEESVIVI
jgi:hypothetical protein